MFYEQKSFTSSASFDDLELLSIEQTLADIAQFIRTVRQQFNSAYDRVILFGSGYGGTLAVYGRSRYPHLVDAAWSSSGIFDTSLYSYGKFYFEGGRKYL